MLLPSSSWTLLGTCKRNLLLAFAPVVSSVPLNSSQAVVSVSDGLLAELGAVGLLLEPGKPCQSSSTLPGFGLLWCQEQGWRCCW